MTDQAQCIRLVEAMGWEHQLTRRSTLSPVQSWATLTVEHPQRGWVTFDSFTDANDDYAVLEWIRKQHFMVLFCECLRRIYLFRRDPTLANTDNYSFDLVDFCEDYQIGDYARAALKVLPKGIE